MLLFGTLICYIIHVLTIGREACLFYSCFGVITALHNVPGAFSCLCDKISALTSGDHSALFASGLTTRQGTHADNNTTQSEAA